MWEAIIPATVSEALLMSAYTAIMALEALGGGTSLRMMLEKIPSVPSEHDMSPAML